MNKIDSYLKVIQEQFNARVALEDISGDFKDEWTDCYEVRCHRRFENKYEKNACKSDCQMRAADKAIARINSVKSKCSSAPDPNRCKKTMENGAKHYVKKIQDFKLMQQKFQAKMKQFRAG
jgi:hypothetical protein